MRLVRRLAILGLPAVLLAVMSASATASPTRWTISPIIDDPSTNNFVIGLAFVPGRNEAWAVGSQRPGASGTARSLAEHWDGTGWTTFPVSDPGKGERLEGVDAAPDGQAWAVGTYIKGPRYAPLTAHWDGTSWIARSLNTSFSDLTSVAALSDNDVWAVGYTFVGPGDACGSGTAPLIEHWNGTAWESITPPAVSGATSPSLAQVVHVGATGQLIALGGYCLDGVRRLLLERYDGTGWSVFDPPTVDGNTQFATVAAAGPDDIMVVVNSGADLVSERWDGTSWTASPIPVPPKDIEVSSPNLTCIPGTHRYWLFTNDTRPGNIHRIMIAQWRSGTWHLQHPPSPGQEGSTLSKIAVASNGQALAVGQKSDRDGRAQAFALQRP